MKAIDLRLIRNFDVIINKIRELLSGLSPTIYLHGSLAGSDFKPGWSDVDLLCVTEKTIPEDIAQTLVHLRNSMRMDYSEGENFRIYEGVFLSKEGFLYGKRDCVVLWGDLSDRITSLYVADVFMILDLLDNGILICGEDIRPSIERPSHRRIATAIKRQLSGIRSGAEGEDLTIAKAGLMLDIARSIYTLENDRVISKTDAGEWALKKGIAPEPQVMEKVLEIRAHPDVYKEDSVVIEWANRLGDSINAFADVLEKRLEGEKD